MNEITVYEQFEADLVAFEAVDAEKKFDVTTAEGYAECKAYHAKLRKVRNGTDKYRKKTNEDAQQAIKTNDTAAKKIISRVDAMADPRKAMMDAQDAKIQAEIDAKIEAARIEKEEAEAKRLADIEAKEKELEERAAKIKEAEDAVKAEEERIEREKKAEADKLKAVEDAKKKAEQDAIEAAKQAETDKQKAIDDAIEAEKEKARQIEQKRIANELAEKHEAERVAGLEKALKENEHHRGEIHAIVHHGFMDYLDDPEQAAALIDVIDKGKISNIIITY